MMLDELVIGVKASEDKFVLEVAYHNSLSGGILYEYRGHSCFIKVFRSQYTPKMRLMMGLKCTIDTK